ncbi:metallophosphoesterase family protein [Helcococcus kunzii]
MNKIRIAHLADFHLGAQLNGRKELNEKVNKALIKSLVNIFDVLNSAKVQLVLIAGDFYESSNIDTSLKSQIKEIFSNFNGKIVISPGNHDYISLESVYFEEWPKNTYIFTSENVDYFEFNEINTRVYGFAFTNSHIREHLISNIGMIDDSYINIGVFHGQIDSTENSYHPIFAEDILNSNLDYIALGHVHKRSEINQIGRTYYAYSGNPVGRGFDETGEKGIYLGDISKDKNGLYFYKIDNSEFHIVNLEIEDFESQNELANFIKRKLEEKFGVNYKKHYYRLILNGYLKKDQTINIDIIESMMTDFNYIEIIDNTNLYMDFDEISHEKSLKGKFVKKVLTENISAEDKKKILDIGVRAFEDLL